MSDSVGIKTYHCYSCNRKDFTSDDEFMSHCKECAPQEDIWQAFERILKLYPDAFKGETGQYDIVELVLKASDPIKRSLLKSLGLYWRRWPQEKPTEQEEIFHEHGRCVTTYQSDEFSDVFREVVGRTSNLTMRTGDRWLPLKALENLP